MLNFRQSKRSIQIELKRREIEVSLSKSKSSNLVLIYPPVNELEEIKQSFSPTISLREAMEQDPFDLKKIFADDLARMQLKEEKFGTSLTFLNHMANLSSLSDDEELAREYLNKARDTGDAEFFANQLAQSYVCDGNLAKATDSLQDPKLRTTVDTYVHLAQLSLATESQTTAIDYIEKALELDPISPDANIVRGGMCMIEGRPDFAIRHFRTAMLESKVSSRVFVNLAMCHFLLDDSRKSLRELQTAIAINPTNENAIVFFSDILFGLKKSGQDIPALTRFLHLDGKSEVGWNRLARANYATRSYSNALDALKHEANLTKHPYVWNNIAVVHDRMGNFAKSERYYSLALKTALKPKHERYDAAFGIMKNLASHYLICNEDEKALSTTKAAIELARQENIEDSKIFPNHVTATLRKEGFDSALTAAREFLDTPSEDEKSRIEVLTRIIGMYGEYGPVRNEVEPLLDQAYDILGRFSSLPENLIFRLLNNVVFTLLQLDDVSQAEEYSRRLSRLVGIDPFVTATFGLLRLKKGEVEKGQDLYKVAISVARDRSLKDQVRQRMNLELGRYYLAAGDGKNATKALSRALSEKLGLEYVRKAAKRLM